MEGLENDNQSIDSDHNSSGAGDSLPDTEPAEEAPAQDVLPDQSSADEQPADTGSEQQGESSTGDSQGTETDESSTGADEEGAGTTEPETESESESESESEPGTEESTEQETETESGTEDIMEAGAGESGVLNLSDLTELTGEDLEIISLQLDQLHQDSVQLHSDIALIACFIILFAVEMAFKYLYRLFRIFI